MISNTLSVRIKIIIMYGIILISIVEWIVRICF